uniref:Transmembrane protein n=1 Tax=Octactis speculum TaxID=3111310 RepID=A0A7S2FHV0_9STRA|mmetsp:Transcript_22195/g.30280  ORF Transcript_22195/g.30280 Transcript_22195/m.30280 type:complete len:283 (+) Transcript_22195:3-851(+)
MITADTQQLETRLKQLALQIREKEIAVFISNLSVLSTQSAFLTGLCFGGMNIPITWNKNDDSVDDFDLDYTHAFELCFFTCTSVGAGLNILTLSICSWCIIFGPGLAIRGPDGSMTRAAEGLYTERKYALRFFWAGVFFCLLSGVFLGFLKFDPLTASFICAIIILFSVFAVLYTRLVTRPRFSFSDMERKPNEILVSGYDPEVGMQSEKSKSIAFGSLSSSFSKKSGSGLSFGSNDENKRSSSFSKINWLQEKGLMSHAEAESRRKQLFLRTGEKILKTKK